MKMIYDESLTFQVQSILLISHKEGIFDVKGRPFAALSFRKSGSAFFKIDGKRIVNEPGDMVYIPANTDYRVEYTAGDSIVVHLTDCNYNIAEKIETLSTKGIESRFLLLRSAWLDNHSANTAKSGIYGIFAILERERAEVKPDYDMQKCIEYLHRFYSNPGLSVEAVCNEIHMSRSSLQRKFIRYFGITAKEYILKLRMNKALDLLNEGGYSIKNISNLCGFEDEKYFSRVFKKRYGHSPASFATKMIM